MRNKFMWYLKKNMDRGVINANEIELQGLNLNSETSRCKI